MLGLQFNKALIKFPSKKIFKNYIKHNVKTVLMREPSCLPHYEILANLAIKSSTLSMTWNKIVNQRNIINDCEMGQRWNILNKKL